MTDLRIAVVAALALFLGFVPQSSGAQEERTFGYQATEEWADSQVMLLPGDRLHVATRAQWANSGPGGELFGAEGFPNGVMYPGTYRPDLPLGAALVRVGDAIWPAINQTLDVTQPGRLRFAMNDVPGRYGDNRGSARAIVRLFLRPALMEDFRGRSLDDLRKFLARWGIEPEVRTGTSELAVGLIYAQEPAPRIDLHDARQVVVHVTEAAARTAPVRVEVPDVIGLSASEGVILLRESGLVPEAREAELSPHPLDTILRTEPEAGRVVVRGTSVRYWPASGENILPDVAGRSVADASRMLNESGFYVVDLQRPRFGRAGRVATQVPLAGIALRLDSRVLLTLTGGIAGRALSGALLLGVLFAAVQAVRQWRRHVYTAGIQMRAALAGDSRTSMSDAGAGPSLAMRCSLVPGETDFHKPPSISNTEARDA